MKKVLLTAAVLFTTCAVSAQTWKLAGDFQKAIYDDENMKLYLPGGQADTAKLYNSLAKMFEYYMKCDEVEQAKVASGELKKPKLRKKLAKTLVSVRPNLTNAGSDAYNAGNYSAALKFFGTYCDAATAPIFADMKEVKNDTLVPLIANYATLAANSLKDNAAVIKYAEMGKNQEEGYRALMCLAEVYKSDEAKDSVKWLAAIKEGVEKFPAQEYFVGNLMDNYIQKGQVKEALAEIDGIIANNPSAYFLYVKFLYVKGVLQYENKDYEGAIATLQQIVDKNDGFVAEAYSKMGDCYFFPGQDIEEANSQLAMDDPKYAEGEAKIKELYAKALPYYEKAKELAPDNKALWGQYMLRIYWKLNRAEYESLEKELGY